MCGIVGILSKDKNKEEVIKKMSERISHRGPDGEGYYINENIALAHRRLAIIDLNTGTQPMTNEDESLVLVFNGEIYNYLELKGELIKDGHKFKTTSDSEVLIHGYEKWGIDLPKHLRGMFAFAIWNEKEKNLFLARDHFGIKPLYYHRDGENFAFASELKSFLDYDKLHKTFNRSLLESYLAFGFTPGNDTFFEEIHKLAPGHCAIISGKKMESFSYFELSFEEESKDLSEIIENISAIVEDSVEHHKISDVEVGSFLSSGVDSSYVVSLAKPQKTYTIGYRDYEENEISYAEDLSIKLGLENKSVLLTKEDYLSSLADVIYYADEPSGDPSITCLYHLSKLASRDVKVVLSGEGADEFFGGYNSYLDEMNLPLYNKLPFIIRHIISILLSKTPEFKGRNYLVRRGIKLEDYYTGVNRNLSDREIEACLLDADLSHLIDISKNIINKYKRSSEVVQKQAVDISCWLTNDILHKADRMGMANSIETRVPFTDIEVFKVASKLSREQKIAPHTTKIALREASKKVIPTEAYKKKKLGFPVPVRSWLKDDLFYEEVKNTFQNSKGNVYFDKDHITRLLEEHRTETKDNYKKIWTIYAFLKWYDIYFADSTIKK